MLWTSRRLAFLTLSIWLAVSANVRADEPAHAAIEQLLTEGWSNSPQARASADRLLAENGSLLAAEPLGIEAYTLVLLQQKRYDEASKRIAQWLERDSDNPFALRARVWLSTLLKNYSAAMLAAEDLSQQIAAVADDTQTREELDEATEFLGRIFGYLDGPAASTVNQPERRKSEAHIVAQLGERRAALFDKSRDSVLQLHLERADAKNNQRDKARNSEIAGREKTLQEIADERATAASRASEMTTERQRWQSELQSQLEQAARDDRPLASEYARLDGAAAGIQRELSNNASQINSLEYEASRERDPVRRDRLRRDADRLRSLGRRINSDFLALQSQASVVQNQRAAIAARAQQVRQDYGGRIDGIDAGFAAMAKREKRLAADETRARKAVTGTTGQVLSLSAQAGALSTYDTLPLEAAKRRVLEHLR